MTEATTYTLATIHERHERLSEAEAHLALWQASDPGQAQFLPEVPAGLPDIIAGLWAFAITTGEGGVKAMMADKLASMRAELKRDALEAFAAFYEGA